MTGDEQVAMATLEELVQVRLQRKDWRMWQSRTAELTGALRALSRDQAHQFAGELLGRYHDDDKAMDLLGQLNTSVPGALAQYTVELAAQGRLLPSWLYLDAPESATRRLIQLIDSDAFDKQKDGVLLALAWVGDAVAQEQFSLWRENPPPWIAQLYIAPHEYALAAGWELTPDGRRRDLYHQTSYELLPLDNRDRELDVHVVVGSETAEASCGWCGRQLVTLLDIDLKDPRCAFIAVPSDTMGGVGTRLRIVHCQWCSAYATLYTDVNLHGGVKWSAMNDALPAILNRVGMGTEEELLPPASRGLILGQKRRTPFEVVGRFMLDETGISQLGGHPEWIQDFEYPLCRMCQRRMVCVGQVSWEDIEEFAEGSTYAFLCLPCGSAATTYQQT